ncbi:MAG TPA: Ig-like domain-containing protein [Kofleriaceae bacterium]|jgi:hypothetical protein|nr:Ig-like domain-containing protein [Kofleriaceae bacterium]
MGTAAVVAAALAVSVVAWVGCSDPGPPPMIEQIRVAEVVGDGSAAVARTVFAFGSYPMATADDAHPVTNAAADGNRLRVIVNELLLGNNLEEIECRYVVDDDVFAPIPVGATPDDVARCAVAQRQLASQCAGSDPHSLCLCQRADGCPSGTTSDGADIITPKGESVGVQDRDQDGAADAMRFIAGRATLTCDSALVPAPIVVPIDLGASFWTPSGNQDRPVEGGFDALGPAIVITPMGPLPTRQTCGLAFSPEVVGKDGITLCAPADGDLARGCTPGDTSAFSFTVQPLGYLADPDIQSIGQSRTDPVLIESDAPLDPVSLENITVTEDAATPYTQFTVAAVAPKAIRVQWAVGLAASTRYTIIVPTTVTDTYHLGAPQPFQVSFTTGN